MSGRHSKAEAPAARVRRARPSLFAALLSASTCLVVQLFGVLVPLAAARFLGLGALSQTLSGLVATTRLGAMPGVWLGVGCSIAVARAHGSHDEDAVIASVHTAVALALLLGLPASVAATMLAPQSLALLAFPARPAPGALDYWYVCCGATFLSLALNVMLGIQRATDGAWHAILCSLASALTTGALSVELLGTLDMGPIGAALALAGGQLVGCALCLAQLTRSKGAHRLRLSRVRIAPAQAAELLACALPLTVQMLAIAAFQALSLGPIASFGDDMVTAWRLIHWLELGLMTVADAFAVATATVVAQAFGAGSYERVRLGPRRLLIAALLLVGSCALAACLVAGSLAQRLGLVEGASELVALLAPLTLPFSVLYALVVVIGAAQRGAGLNMRPTVVTVVGCCVAPLLWLVLAVPRLHSIVTVALARPLAWGVTAAIMLVYYRHGRWLTLALRKARKQRNSRSKGRRKRTSSARHRA